jgi:hypothetical protein
LVQLAADMAHQGEVVVVVVPSRVLVEQWTERLRAAGVPRVSELRKATEAVVALDDAERRAAVSPGVVVANIHVLRHGAGRRAGALLSPSLLIVERPPINVRAGAGAEPSAFDAPIAELAARAQRTVVATNLPSEVPWLRPTETLQISLAEALEERPTGLQFVLARHIVTPDEADVYDQAQQLISEVGGTLPIRASTRPAMHGTLMRLAARLSGEALEEPEDVDGAFDEAARPAARPGLLDDIWKVLDRLEGLEGDSRLELLIDVVSTALEARRPVMIVTDRVDEVEYVAGRLRDLSASVSAVTGSTEHSDRRRVAEHFAAGTVIAATRAAFDWLEQPADTEQVWWSPPRTIADAVQRVTRSGEGGRIVAIIAEPPQAEDRRLLGLLERLQAETGLDLVTCDD